MGQGNSKDKEVTNQETINSQTDAQLDSINFGGDVNTGGGHIYLNPRQGNEQLPSLSSTSTQTISITHGELLKYRFFF